jgi:asparagine synthase (glutamine-hydrolysing)
MCGFAGVIGPVGCFESELEGALAAASKLLQRRGPDASGSWMDPDGRGGLVFRRLSIIDLSPDASQPMLSADGRHVVVFNGEIYNFRALRAELASHGCTFRTESDSEVLVEALAHWGGSAVRRLDGMFAFAWYARDERALRLVRDHAGIKPLYYGLNPSRKSIAFGSQFNVLAQLGGAAHTEVSFDVLRLYLRLHHIPAPYGLLQGTHQVRPGEIVRFDDEGRTTSERWWALPRSTDRGLPVSEAAEEAASLIDAAVERQLVADVPLGTFLSGGIDSPLVTSFAAARKPGVMTFTLGNPGWSQDEAADASRFAGLFDTRHATLQADGDMALACLDDVIEAQCEPFADFSIIPTLLLSRFARRSVTVALSGDGGDEVFYGYQRPGSLLRDGWMFRLPMLLRKTVYGAGKLGIGKRRSGAVLYADPGDYYFRVNCRLSDAEIGRLAPGLGALPDDFSLYDYEGDGSDHDLADFSRWAEFGGQLQRCLKKVDMASMHESLEVRVPLLSRDLIEFSLGIEHAPSIVAGDRKPVLRNLLAERVGGAAISAEKRGFAVPLGNWLRGPLRKRVEETLFDAELYPTGVFDRAALMAYWEEHRDGVADHKWGLWTILALQWWAARHGMGRVDA